MSIFRIIRFASLSVIALGIAWAVNAADKKPAADANPTPSAPLPTATASATVKTPDSKPLMDESILRETPDQRRERFRAAMLKIYDKNGTGKLDAAEEQRMRQDLYARYQSLLKKYDKNKNGYLDPSEVATMEADIAKRRQIFLQNFDKNHDGKLDEQEAAALRTELEKRRADYLEGFRRSVY
jgi:Ca2+-binding EF-hand superfamily protein